jgi:hypothetical protein
MRPRCFKGVRILWEKRFVRDKTVKETNWEFVSLMPRGNSPCQRLQSKDCQH